MSMWYATSVVTRLLSLNLFFPFIFMYKSVARAVLFNNEGEVLLVQGRPDAIWTTPGGHVET